MAKQQYQQRTSSSGETWTDPVSDAAKEAAADWRTGRYGNARTRKEFCRGRGVEFWQFLRAYHRLPMADYHARVRGPRGPGS